jgi:hypothetical protein
MKRLLLIIGSILLILLVLGFIAPKEYVSKREILIHAPKAHIYSRYISSLEGLHSWRTLLKNDSTSRVDYKGTPGTVGSKAEWTASYGSHGGREEVIRVIPLKRIEFKIRYIKPWESLNHADISIEEKGDSQCIVTYRFEGHNPFPFNIQHLFMNMDFKMGSRLMRDLECLKDLGEESYLEERYSIRLEKQGKRYYRLVLDSIFDRNEARQLAIQRFRQSSEKLNEAEIERLPSPVMMANKLDTNHYLYKVVYEIADTAEIEASEVLIEIEPRESLIAQYLGDFRHLSGVHNGLMNYLEQRKSAEADMIIESYLVHPGIEGDTSKWLTNIRYMLVDNN